MKKKKANEKKSFADLIDEDLFWRAYDKGEEYGDERGQERRMSLQRMAPDAEIDLHGRRAEEAERLLGEFLRTAHRRGWRKVLVIHGKGSHSSDGPILKKICRRVLESSPYAGKSGTPGRELGGSGATWVLIK